MELWKMREILAGGFTNDRNAGMQKTDVTDNVDFNDVKRKVEHFQI